VSEQALHAAERTSPAQLTDSALATSAGTRPGTLIFSSKLHPPATRRGTVVRQALLDRLSADMPARLVLVVAPAGWGKTSLLCDWCAANGTEGTTGWMSVDQDDNDPVRFWAHLVAAVDTVSPGIGTAALEVLTAPGVKTVDAVLNPVINDFGRMPARVTLVVDDYHLITNQAIQEGVEFLVDHLPPTLCLVLATRSDPALPLARLRARGQMAEIRTDELRFSEAETEELLNETLGLALPPEEVHALQQRAEGWAAGLYLAGLSLRGRKDTAGIIRAFSGNDRQIVDYFAAEVLAGLPPRIRSLLLRTSVLDRLAGPLCDAVTGADGSQRLLEEIERSQLFLVPLDNAHHWFRYHTLFAEMLRRELDQSDPGLAPLLHRRASAWHRKHGSIEEAIGHAISAGDLADARELIASHWYLLVHEGLTETVGSWLDCLPPEMVVEDARMCLIRGFLARWLGRLDEVEPWLTAAQATAPKGSFPEGPASVESAAFILRAGYCHMIGDLAGSEVASRRAVDLEAAGRPWWRTVVLATLGANLFWRGQDAEACSILEQVVEPTHPPANKIYSSWALGCLSAIYARRGDLEACERRLQQATDLATRHRGGGHWMTAIAVLTSADLLAGRGELAEAEEAALRALERAQRGRARVETACALLCVARISSQAGNTDDARARISQARELIGSCATPGVLTELLAATEEMAGEHPAAAGPRQRTHPSRPDGLTDREAQVLELLAAGNTNNEIAAELVVSIHTVERHLQNAYRKIRVRNRADAAAYVVRDALNTPEFP
jgi:LuxR family maltose regulon positive regulatory protein